MIGMMGNMGIMGCSKNKMTKFLLANLNFLIFVGKILTMLHKKLLGTILKPLFEFFQPRIPLINRIIEGLFNHISRTKMLAFFKLEKFDIIKISYSFNSCNSWF